MNQRLRTLFLCTGNSARSQMAEALLRQQAGDSFEVCSAGTQPEGVDPRALAALAQFGIESGGLESKSVEAFRGQRFDLVITLCDKARQECRSIPGASEYLAWDLPDPKQRGCSDPFGKTLLELAERIRLLVLVKSKRDTSPQLSALALFKCLADETRLQLMLLVLAEGELCVGELTHALQQAQPTISRQLAQLRQAGLLQDQRRGQWVFYRPHPELPDWAQSLLATTLAQSQSLIESPRARLLTMPERPGRPSTGVEA